jgi:endogenous inhibitor of DNA gyrase (YacG/DUF329 family)
MERQCPNCGRSILFQFITENEWHFYNNRGDIIDQCPDCGAPIQTNATQERKVIIEPKNAA